MLKPVAESLLQQEDLPSEIDEEPLTRCAKKEKISVKIRFW
jgi:hypothetical protein